MSIRSERPLTIGEAAGTVLEIAGRMTSGAGGWSLAYAATARDVADLVLADCRSMLASMQDEAGAANDLARKLKALGQSMPPTMLHPQATTALAGLPAAGPRLNDSHLAVIWMYSIAWGSGCAVHDDLDALLTARTLLSNDLRALEQRVPELESRILRVGAAA